MLPAFTTAMNCIGGFETRPTLAVAVSGGIDSMALLLLADRWAKTHAGKVVALTVDHHLRPESGEEAKQVYAWCAARGIEHHTLDWKPESLSSAIQDKARNARYRLLSEWCRAHDVLHLLTAHHRDDQAETLFFRLARGSGLDGLAAMPYVSITHGVRLIRPLLSVSKAELQKVLQQQQQAWVSDPSNEQTYYTRNLIRAQLTPALSERAAALAQRMGVMRNHRELQTARHMVSACEIYPQGYGAILENKLQQMDRDYALRMIASLMQALSGAPYANRQEKLERLCAEMKATGFTKRSFGGCIVQYQPKKSRFLIYREMKSLGQEMQLSAGETALWDQRFHVAFTHPENTSQKLSVRALGANGSAILKKLSKSMSLPLGENAVLPLLPSFWNLEQLVAVPHIGYTDKDWCSFNYLAQFIPAKALAGTAFSSMNVTSESARKECA